MKRKAPYKAWFWGEYTKGKIAPEILQAVGHLSFLWNDVEEGLDRALSWALEVPVNLQVAVRSRINGLEGKIEIVKASVHENTFLTDDQKKMLLITLGAFQGMKERRDAVMHAKGSEVMKDSIARTFERRGAVYEVLLTIDALNLLNTHLEIYNREIAALAGVLNGATRTGQVFKKALEKSALAPGPNAETLKLAAQADQRYAALVLDNQRLRSELPPLPELPLEAPVLQRTAATPPS